MFNPSFTRGGKLNVTQIAYWNLGVGFTLKSRQSKIERRHDLKGLWFHAVIGVKYQKYLRKQLYK